MRLDSAFQFPCWAGTSSTRWISTAYWTRRSVRCLTPRRPDPRRFPGRAETRWRSWFLKTSLTLWTWATWRRLRVSVALENPAPTSQPTPSGSARARRAFGWREGKGQRRVCEFGQACRVVAECLRTQHVNQLPWWSGAAHSPAATVTPLLVKLHPPSVQTPEAQTDHKPFGTPVNHTKSRAQPGVPHSCCGRSQRSSASEDEESPAQDAPHVPVWKLQPLLRLPHAIAERRPTLGCVRPEWFRGKKVLDVGCSTGHVTLAIAGHWSPERVLGIDIDGALVRIARQNLRHFLSEMPSSSGGLPGEGSEVSGQVGLAPLMGLELERGKALRRFPVSFMRCRGPIAAPPIMPHTSGLFPCNVYFLKVTCVCVCERECVCVCVCERERERESVCVCGLWGHKFV